MPEPRHVRGVELAESAAVLDRQRLGVAAAHVVLGQFLVVPAGAVGQPGEGADAPEPRAGLPAVALRGDGEELLPREEPQEPFQLGSVEAAAEEIPTAFRQAAGQLLLATIAQPAHLPALGQVVVVVGQGAVHRIPQHHDEPCVGQQVPQATSNLGHIQVARCDVAKDNGRRPVISPPKQIGVVCRTLGKLLLLIEEMQFLPR
mmetsp:Transcript_174797/g.554728  ORF Transcript_174797/g.554728 Transcript_174797/m.554728 type:complete len:203 (+) Transcript_174797:225-833(+)